MVSARLARLCMVLAACSALCRSRTVCQDAAETGLTERNPIWHLTCCLVDRVHDRLDCLRCRALAAGSRSTQTAFAPRVWTRYPACLEPGRPGSVLVGHRRRLDHGSGPRLAWLRCGAGPAGHSWRRGRRGPVRGRPELRHGPFRRHHPAPQTWVGRRRAVLGSRPSSAMCVTRFMRALSFCCSLWSMTFVQPRLRFSRSAIS